RHSFDLAKGPLLNAVLLRLGPQDHILLVVMHHGVADRESVRVLLREMATLSGALANHHSAPLPELPVQFGEVAGRQREWLRGAEARHQLDYWKQQLANLPVALELPTDRPRAAVQRFHGARHVFALSPSLTEALNHLSRQENVPLSVTLLAAFQT